MRSRRGVRAGTNVLSLVALAAAAALAACGDGADPAKPPPPTYLADGAIEGVSAKTRFPVVLIDCAGLRYDAVFPRDGSASGTPAIARFLKDATSFRNAASAAGWDVPAFATLLTGLSPRDHQTVEVYGRDAPALNQAWPTLAEMLKAQGWRTAVFSRRGMRLSDHGLAQGFDAVEESWSGGDAAGIAAVRAWLDRPAGDASKDGPPFLLLRPTLLPAVPAAASADAPLDLGAAKAAYAAAAAALDAEVARLLEAVRASPHAKDAVVVLTAGHGYALGEDGGRVGPGTSTRDEMIRVPLGIAAAGMAKGNVEGSCSLRDVAPTVLALAGLPAPQGAGWPLGPLAAKPQGKGLPAYAEDWARLPMTPPGVRRLHTLRTARGKYTARLHVASKEWDERIFDLQADPEERRPLPADALPGLGDDLAEAVAAMRAWLQGRVDHFRSVGDAGYHVSDDD